MFVAACFLLIGCGLYVCQSCRRNIVSPINSAYYWSTIFQLDSTQRQFIADNNIRRLYIRFFDVLARRLDNPLSAHGDTRSVMAKPNAGILFQQPVPEHIEVIPVVFILPDVFLNTQESDSLHRLVLDRVIQMCETHDIHNVKELQIDCDWTPRTRQAYFLFLRNLTDAAHQRGINISTTIRLHQLSQEVPAVDRGVLMFYNTGDVAHPAGRNPILDMRDATPYLSHLKGYDLPLATAYPAFGWRVAYRKGALLGILHADDEIPLLETDTVITFQPILKQVIEARDAVQQRRPDANNELILFDISQQHIPYIQRNQYEKVYHR